MQGGWWSAGGILHMLKFSGSLVLVLQSLFSIEGSQLKVFPCIVMKLVAHFLVLAFLISYGLVWQRAAQFSVPSSSKVCNVNTCCCVAYGVCECESCGIVVADGSLDGERFLRALRCGGGFDQQGPLWGGSLLFFNEFAGFVHINPTLIGEYPIDRLIPPTRFEETPGKVPIDPFA